MDLRVLSLPHLPPKNQMLMQVYLLFYRPTALDPILNRLVAAIDSPFCHIEITIPHRFGQKPWERTMWGSSIYQNEPVFFKEKTYKRDGYVSVAIELTLEQVRQIRDFCDHHAKQETPFSQLAMFAAYLPFQLFQTDATFCSKHVAQALQAAGLLAGVNASLMTPSRLYHHFKPDAIVQMVPSRMVFAMEQQQQQQRQRAPMPAILRLPVVVTARTAKAYI